MLFLLAIYLSLSKHYIDIDLVKWQIELFAVLLT